MAESNNISESSDELFSCRNCIHNPSQSLNVGQGAGFCLRHDSVIFNTRKTTCKYLHRKDLAFFLVEEGVREHAAEFALCPGIANLESREHIARLPYSEKFAWEQGLFDPLTHAVAQYHKTTKPWIFIQSIAAGVDGRRAIAYASLVRRYVSGCETWKSSYRLFLGFIQEIDSTPEFEEKQLLFRYLDQGVVDAKKQALWDAVFSRISALQEYGWHASLEELMWVTDVLDGALSAFDWPRLKNELAKRKQPWTEQIIEHARTEGAFFPIHPQEDSDE
jgi:hypothetical protein